MHPPAPAMVMAWRRDAKIHARAYRVTVMPSVAGERLERRRLDRLETARHERAASAARAAGREYGCTQGEQPKADPIPVH